MATDLPPSPPAAAPQAAIVAPSRESETIAVESHGFRYEVKGNALLPPDRIRSVLETVESPQAAIEALHRAYQGAGFFLTGLVGQVDGQTVRLRVVHGRVTEKDLTPALAPFFAGIEGREDVDRNMLIRKSALAEAYAAREGMRPKLTFAPAKEAGGTRMTVTEEPIEGYRSANGNLGFNNLGSRFSSRYVAQGGAALRPGRGLELTLNYTHGIPGLSDDSSGSVYDSGVAGLSAITPWGVYAASYTNTHYRIGLAGGEAKPDGQITSWSITGTQLLYADETGRAALTESFTRTNNYVTLGGFDDFVLTNQLYNFVGVGGSASRSFSVLGQSANLGASVTGLKGLSPPTGTFLPENLGLPADQPGIPSSRFGMIQGSLNYLQTLPEGFSASLSVSGQWADATVPQNQQWVLGGYGNLTAWLPAVLVGDSGGLSRLSVSSRSWEWSGLRVSGTAFMEAGVARLHYTPVDTPVTRGLGDAGLGLSGSIAGGTSLALGYAWPIAYHNLDEKAREGLNRGHLYFSLNQSF